MISSCATVQKENNNDELINKIDSLFDEKFDCNFNARDNIIIEPGAVSEDDSIVIEMDSMRVIIYKGEMIRELKTTRFTY